MTRPRDIADLYFAPVALGVDAELASLDHLTQDELLTYIVLVTNREPRSGDERREYFVEAVTRHLPMHGWRATLDPRGLRLSNDEHSVVLGLPPGIRSYLSLPDAATG
jgi:hypothetical protein